MCIQERPGRRENTRRKLARLSEDQFKPLSTDVYEEIRRRKTDGTLKEGNIDVE